MSRSDYPWWTSVVSFLASLLLRVLGSTWRIERIDPNGVAEHAAAGQPVLFSLWHSSLITLAYTHRGWRAAVLVSRHRDGELIAQTVHRLGYATGRGSSTRGGVEGLREMMDWAEKGFTLALTPDGPRGPAEKVKPGIIYLAARTGLPLVPLGMAASSQWTFGSWDRMRLPRPFARVILQYGPALAVPRDPTADEVAQLQSRLEQAMSGVAAEISTRLPGLRGETRAAERKGHS